MRRLAVTSTTKILAAAGRVFGGKLWFSTASWELVLVEYQKAALDSGSPSQKAASAPPAKGGRGVFICVVNEWTPPPPPTGGEN